MIVFVKYASSRRLVFLNMTGNGFGSQVGIKIPKDMEEIFWERTKLYDFGVGSKEDVILHILDMWMEGECRDSDLAWPDSYPAALREPID